MAQIYKKNWVRYLKARFEEKMSMSKEERLKLDYARESKVWSKSKLKLFTCMKRPSILDKSRAKRGWVKFRLPHPRTREY